MDNLDHEREDFALLPRNAQHLGQICLLEAGLPVVACEFGRLSLQIQEQILDIWVASGWGGISTITICGTDYLSLGDSL